MESPPAESCAMVRFYFRDNFYNDGSLPTASLSAVVKLHGSENRDWRDPLVVVASAVTPASHTFADLAWNGDSGGEVEVAGMTLGDLRAVIDYSLGYRKGRTRLGIPVEVVAASWERMGLTVCYLDPWLWENFE